MDAILDLKKALIAFEGVRAEIETYTILTGIDDDTRKRPHRW